MWKLRFPGRLRRSNVGVDRVRQAYVGAPDKSIPRTNAVPDAPNDCPQNYSKPRSSTTIQSISSETYNTIDSSEGSMRQKSAQKFCNVLTFESHSLHI